MDLRDVAARKMNAIWYGGSMLRWPLWPLGLLMRVATGLRRKLYRQGLLKSTDLPVPVIVVGNLSVGGTGKTPLVIWLAEKLEERDYRVGVICRGYGGTAETWPQTVLADGDAQLVGDEAVLIARRTRCPVMAGPDRVAAAQRLLGQHRIDVIVSDDGMQHYRLGRQIELATVDGVRGLGNGLCLPAGPLREPASRLREVDAIVVQEGEWGHAGVLRTRVRVTRVYELATGRQTTLDSFKGRMVHAIAAIGHPERFFDMLEDHGMIVDDHPLRDHAQIADPDLVFPDGHPVLLTEKDAVKCTTVPGNVWCVVTDLEFLSGDDERLMRIIMRDLQARATGE